MRFISFDLKTLLIAIALLSIPLAWTAYQLNWIRQRHAFLLEEQPDDVPVMVAAASSPSAPWPLWLFGEKGVGRVLADPADKERAKRLFPEAKILAWRGVRIDESPRDYSLIGPGN